MDEVKTRRNIKRFEIPAVRVCICVQMPPYGTDTVSRIVVWSNVEASHLHTKESLSRKYVEVSNFPP